MRLSRHGAKIIGIFLFGGVAMLASAILITYIPDGGFPGAVLGIVGILWVLGALVAVAVAVRVGVRARQAESLNERGLRGTATIVELLSAPGATLHAVLDLELPGQPRRRVERKLFVGPVAGHGLRPGMKLPVFADPEDPDDLLVGL